MVSISVGKTIDILEDVDLAVRARISDLIDAVQKNARELKGIEPEWYTEIDQSIRVRQAIYVALSRLKESGLENIDVGYTVHDRILRLSCLGLTSETLPSNLHPTDIPQFSDFEDTKDDVQGSAAAYDNV